jgi:hypothetical protein
VADRTREAQAATAGNGWEGEAPQQEEGEEPGGGDGDRGPAAGKVPNSNTLDILYLNAQSIVKKLDELNCLAVLTKPDIILITDTW